MRWVAIRRRCLLASGDDRKGHLAGVRLQQCVPCQLPEVHAHLDANSMAGMGRELTGWFWGGDWH